MKLQEKNISENNFEQCIKCTVCTVYCPVVPLNPLYPGPKQAGPDGERLRLKGSDFYDDTLKYCMNCKRCEVACPSNVKIGDIIQHARMEYGRQKPSLRDRVLASTDFMGTMAVPFSPVVNWATSLRPTKAVLDAVMKVDKHREFPNYAKQTFEKWYRKHAEADQDRYLHHLTFFHGCYINYNYPQLGKDFVAVMNALGWGVHLQKGEKCCGVAMISNGLYKKAKKNAQVNVDNFRQSLQENRPVVGCSSTCIFTMRDEYPHVLGIENEEVRNHIDLATRFIYTLLDEGEIQLIFKKDWHRRVAYHTPCHMEKLGWAIYSESLLKLIPGIDFVHLESQCCGIAGTYGFKKENYKVSQGIGAPLFKQIEAAHLDFVSTDCETCKWQIEMSTGVPVKHPVSVLAEALDLEKTYQANNKTR